MMSNKTNVKLSHSKSVNEHRGDTSGSPSKSVAFNGYCRKPETRCQTNIKLNHSKSVGEHGRGKGYNWVSH